MAILDMRWWIYAWSRIFFGILPVSRLALVKNTVTLFARTTQSKYDPNHHVIFRTVGVAKRETEFFCSMTYCITRKIPKFFETVQKSTISRPKSSYLLKFVVFAEKTEMQWLMQALEYYNQYQYLLE